MSRLFVVILISFSSFLSVFGQIAPDFTFTDIEGTTHNLQHALNQNFIVVVEFFFSDCGPCITSAGELQAIHEDYQGKNVLVWAISDVDDDERIEEFHAEMGLEYISGGTEGGGIEVLGLFCENNTFIGYPTVAVICPDGDLTWDIYPYSLGAPEWRMAMEKCGVEDAQPYEPYGSVTANFDRLSSDKSTVLIAPNPTTDFVKISFAEAEATAEIEVKIYNSVGQFLKKVKHLPTKNSGQEMIIPTSELKQGVYFLEMEKENKKHIEVIKILIQR